MLGRVVNAMGIPIDGRGVQTDHNQRRVEEVTEEALPNTPKRKRI